MYKPKEFRYILQSWNDGGWGTECGCEDYADAKKQYKCYMENLPKAYRIAKEYKESGRIVACTGWR